MKSTLHQLAEYGHRQQEELLQKQQQLQQVHDHLMENSKSILAAQESFESKQASMFIALDKLFTLHNAMLLESRLIKAFFIYFISMDYEVLNNQLLHTLIEKVNGMQRYQKLSWEEDSEFNWSSWIDTNLQEDVDSSEDPDYLVPEEVGEILSQLQL
ncbi:gamete expressed protein 1 [Prunus dulcis]|uniref:Gamete expressed protein 1 n=1 Tax=Prunus dulcis TaxID=3755 RepID=A0A4Y1R6F6_PRUDU|nr:gamete expressed protein 1 [Prunus dulcis]